MNLTLKEKQILLERLEKNIAIHQYKHFCDTWFNIPITKIILKYKWIGQSEIGGKDYILNDWEFYHNNIEVKFEAKNISINKLIKVYGLDKNSYFYESTIIFIFEAILKGKNLWCHNESENIMPLPLLVDNQWGDKIIELDLTQDLNFSIDNKE